MAASPNVEKKRFVLTYIDFRIVYGVEVFYINRKVGGMPSA